MTHYNKESKTNAECVMYPKIETEIICRAISEVGTQVEMVITIPNVLRTGAGEGGVHSRATVSLFRPLEDLKSKVKLYTHQVNAWGARARYMEAITLPTFNRLHLNYPHARTSKIIKIISTLLRKNGELDQNYIQTFDNLSADFAQPILDLRELCDSLDIICSADETPIGSHQRPVSVSSSEDIDNANRVTTTPLPSLIGLLSVGDAAALRNTSRLARSALTDMESTAHFIAGLKDLAEMMAEPWWAWRAKVEELEVMRLSRKMKAVKMEKMEEEEDEAGKVGAEGVGMGMEMELGMELGIGMGLGMGMAFEAERSEEPVGSRVIYGKGEGYDFGGGAWDEDGAEGEDGVESAFGGGFL